MLDGTTSLFVDMCEFFYIVWCGFCTLRGYLAESLELKYESC